MDKEQQISARGMATLVVGTGILVGLLACGGGGSSTSSGQPAHFQVNSLVSDQASTAGHQDADLKNAWGIAYGPSTKFWVANQGTQTSTIYDGSGATGLAAVTIPSVAAAASTGPTGLVFNGTTEFLGDKFIFVSLDGIVSGWSSVTDAVVRKTTTGSYTGAATGSVTTTDPVTHVVTTTNYLYAANFGGGTIKVWDGTYALANLGAGAFQDPTIPAGYFPFNIQNLGGKLYVAYAERVTGGSSAVVGAGKGYINIFNTDGTPVGRLVSAGDLDAPWGMAIAPAGFGDFGGALLVGNFGDGRISAFNAATGAPLGQIPGNAGAPLTIPGLWGIVFGNGGSAGLANELYFASGPGSGAHGLVGSIAFVAASSSGGGGGGTGGGGYGY